MRSCRWIHCLCFTIFLLPFFAARVFAAESFFPIMPWDNAPNDSAVLRELRECGFTLAGFVAPKTLDACRAAGLKAIVNDPRATSLDWTLARLPMLSDRDTDRPVAAGFVGDPRIRVFSLSRHALAAFLLAQLRDRAWIRRAPALRNG